MELDFSHQRISSTFKPVIKNDIKTTQVLENAIIMQCARGVADSTSGFEKASPGKHGF